MGAWGDVGMLWTDDSYLAKKIYNIRAENGPTDVHTGVVSGSFHQDTVHAAFLQRKFEGWQKKAKKRSEQISAFVLAMRDRRICEIAIPEFYNHFGTELVILADHRSELMEYLQKRNIETSTWWPLPIHLQPGFQSLGHEKGDFPQAEWVTTRLLQLPVPENENEIDCLVESIANFYKSSFYPQRVF
jgi:dTDP-4-amino-4,6-dideoxygalactose transaminase